MNKSEYILLKKINPSVGSKELKFLNFRINKNKNHMFTCERIYYLDIKKILFLFISAGDFCIF